MLGMLDDFQKNVVFVVLIIFIIILFFIGLFLYRNRNKYTGENKIKDSNCPDYWNEISYEKGFKCLNIKSLGTCNQPEIDFSDSKWNGKNGLCNKLEWAKKCNLTWDGITNNPDLNCKN